MKTMAELKTLSQWVGYTAKKVPMCPHTGGAAASNNPETWGTAAQAWAAKKRYGWAGIGYVFTIGAGVVGVDLDDCFEGEGNARRLTDTARQIVQMLNSYTELSPSGNGLHILSCGAIPHSIKSPGFEMYNELRYFTVTGRVYGEPLHIEDRETELNALYATYENASTTMPEYDGELVTPGNKYADAALLSAMRNVSTMAEGGRHNRLYSETAALVELVNAGALSRFEVERVMTAASIACGLPIPEAGKVIADAFEKVKKARAIPPPRPRYTAQFDAV